MYKFRFNVSPGIMVKMVLLSEETVKMVLPSEETVLKDS